jgi:hypothetical protein
MIHNGMVEVTCLLTLGSYGRVPSAPLFHLGPAEALFDQILHAPTDGIAPKGFGKSLLQIIEHCYAAQCAL